MEIVRKKKRDGEIEGTDRGEGEKYGERENEKRDGEREGTDRGE